MNPHDWFTDDICTEAGHTRKCPVTEADIRFIRNCAVLARVLQQKAPEMRCGHMEGQAIELAEKLNEMREEAR